MWIVLTVIGLGSYSSLYYISYINAQQDEDPLQKVSNIRNLLNQTMTEYKNANYTGASELVDVAYIDNYEYIEDPLKDRDKDLMEQTEVLIRENFSDAINDQVAIENINSMYSKIQNNLDLIEKLFRQN
jgi:hypothetical protein